MDPAALSFLTKAAPCDMPDLFKLIQNNEKRTVAYPVHERWLDVGRPDDLLKAGLESTMRNEK
jgi:NDP-sugar pyrophosphorylase family protein